MKTFLVIARISEFGGVRTYFLQLSSFLAKYNAYYVFESNEEAELALRIGNINENRILIVRGLHGKPRIPSGNIFKTAVHLVLTLVSLLRLIVILLRTRASKMIISSADPEKLIYAFLIPLINIYHITHTVPYRKGNYFTGYVCNRFLAPNKQIIAVSEFCKNKTLEYWKLGINSAKNICVIHNTSFNERDFLGNKYFIGNKLILTLGHVVDYKNPELWLSVAKVLTGEFEDIEFLWIGDGPLFNKMRTLTLGNNRIRFERKEIEISKYLSSCYLYYHPSRIENHSIAVLEAMASAIPCVVSNSGGLPESIIDNYNGLVVKENCEDDHVSAIRRFITDSSLASKFSSKSRELYLSKFSNSIWVKKMNELID